MFVGHGSPFKLRVRNKKGRYFSAQSFILRRGEGADLLHGLCGACRWRSFPSYGFTKPRPFAEEDVPLVEFMYLVFTRMPSESYRRRLGSLLLFV